MARQIGRLSARTVATRKRRGMYPDGGGLYLQVTAAGARSWLYRYMLHSRTRYMGLGPLHAVTLAEARVKATEARRLRQAGIDPIEARDAGLAKTRLEAARSITFKDAA
ncbi:MAG: Arm DNA-binding domain-containing protein, partial [Proteobacteria bacterium]|nr:Arm DNA-binding domain-containing protein [Pseudomonadota bacterium]